MSQKSINHILCAALVDPKFRDDLMGDPIDAISKGYYEHVFHLSDDEKYFFADVKAQSLEDFAYQVHRYITASNDPAKRNFGIVPMGEVERFDSGQLYEFSALNPVVPVLKDVQADLIPSPG